MPLLRYHLDMVPEEVVSCLGPAQVVEKYQAEVAELVVEAVRVGDRTGWVLTHSARSLRVKSHQLENSLA